jgi:hypothetical protein
VAQSILSDKAVDGMRPVRALLHLAGKHPADSDVAMVKIDDELMARDTTCVDAIDHDGMMFSATPVPA